MSVERVLPKTLDYTDVLPLAVESKSRRRTFFPNNGAEFISNGANIIRIDISADALLDTQHSYLRFAFRTQSGIGPAHAQTRGIDYAGGHSFIRRLRVEQSGTVLEDIQSYNRLMGAVVLPCQSTSEHKKTRTITEAVCPDGATIGAPNVILAPGGNATTGQASIILGQVNNSNTQIAAAAAPQQMCIPLTSGLLNCDKLVPLMLMSAPLTIEIELANETQCMVSSAAPAEPYRISDVRYVAQLVEVGQDVSQQLRMLQEVSGGVLTLAGQTYRHFQGQLPAGVTNNVINVPARVKSMKSIFFASQGAGNDANNTYDVGTGGHMGLTSYQLKIGSVVYPPTAVSATAAGVGLATAAECLMELEKAWGNTGSRFGLSNETGMSTFYSQLEVRSTGSAGVAAALGNGAYRFAPFGLDLEAFQKVAIESGVNTADRSLPISLITEHTGGQAVTTIDVWVLADALFYINQDGSMSVSV